MDDPKETGFPLFMNKTTQSLTQQASKGAFWALASNVIVSAVSFCGTAVLARMLSPKDFGLISMAVLVTGVVQLFADFGLGAALVQKKDVTDEDLSTVFWVNIAAGVALTVICILISPLAAIFFRESSVMWVMISLAVNFFLSAICSIHNTLVYKSLQMKSLAVIEVSGRIIRVGAMIIAAFCGLTFWSIVIGMVIERTYKTIAFFFIHPWRPSFIFSTNKFNEMFRFGRNLLGGNILGYINQSMDALLTGRMLGADLLGFYQMSYNLPNLLRDYIKDSIGPVSFPVFCKVQDDNERLARGFLKIVRCISVITFPVLAGLSFTARDFIIVAYGERWLPVVVPMQVLCLGAAIASISTVVGSLLYAKGRPDIGLKWGFWRLPLTAVSIFAGVHFGGIVGVAWGVVSVQIVSLLLAYVAFRIIDSDFRTYWFSLIPAIVGSIVMIFMLFLMDLIPLLSTASPWLRLILDIILGASAYVGVIVFCFKDTLEDFLKLIGSMLKNQ